MNVGLPWRRTSQQHKRGKEGWKRNRMSEKRGVMVIARLMKKDVRLLIPNLKKAGNKAIEKRAQKGEKSYRVALNDNRRIRLMS